MLGTALLRIFCHAVAGPCSVVPTTALERKRYRRVFLSLHNFVISISSGWSIAAHTVAVCSRLPATGNSQQTPNSTCLAWMSASCLVTCNYINPHAPSQPSRSPPESIPDDEVVPGTAALRVFSCHNKALLIVLSTLYLTGLGSRGLVPVSLPYAPACCGVWCKNKQSTKLQCRALAVYYV